MYPVSKIEATIRFELMIRVLQTHALPLGYVALNIKLVTPRGFEPLLPPWKGGVLTAWPWSLASSPSRARTYNNSVNSRVLYHWAIEEYLLNYRCQLLSQRHVISYHIFIVLSTTFFIFFACTLKTAHKLFISNLLPFPTLTFLVKPSTD